MIKKIAACLFGWCTGLAIVIVLYWLADRASTATLLAISFAAGFVIGCCAGFLQWLAARAGTFSCASFFGVLTGMLPAILVTYGFALAWLPVAKRWGSGLTSRHEFSRCI